MSAQRFWFWPGWRQLGFALALSTIVAAVFIFVYGGADWLTDQHSYRVRMHTPADLAIPLLPEAAVAYLSLNVLFWICPFVLRTRRELVAFAATLLVTTLAAGVFFVALPVADAFDPAEVHSLRGWTAAYDVARVIALHHNYFPSLHVAFATICVLAYGEHAAKFAKLLLGAWWLAIVASTLLIHEHYLVDVVSGLLLGWCVERWGYRSWCFVAAPPAPPTTQASASPPPSQSA